MLIHRCPYCGEKISTAKSLALILMDWWPFTCPTCHHKYRLHYPKILWITIPFGLYALLYLNTDIFKHNFPLNVAAIAAAMAAVLVIGWFIPLERYEYGDIVSFYEVDYLAKCRITWRNKSRFFRTVSFVSGCIYPVCFMDSEGTPTSLMWCAVFRKIRHRRKYSKCNFEFVMEEAPRDLLKVGNRFSVFYEKEIVAVGEIQEVECFGSST